MNRATGRFESLLEASNGPLEYIRRPANRPEGSDSFQEEREANLSFLAHAKIEGLHLHGDTAAVPEIICPGERIEEPGSMGIVAERGGDREASFEITQVEMALQLVALVSAGLQFLGDEVARAK